MEGIIHLDSLYLVVKYPHLDIFENWYPHARDVDYKKLKEGIVVGDFVIKGGASTYKFSLWQHDARVFLTDQVDEKIGDGKGSGIWIQLGPKFLIHHAYNLHNAITELLLEIGIKRKYPISISRIDLAMDLFGVDMQDQDLSIWQAGWVGRSKVSSTYFNSRTGALETINIGSRKSSIYLRIYDKVAQAIAEGDIEYWLDIWKGFEGSVTRIEWEVKPRKGNFGKDLQDFHLFTPGFSVIELWNYLLDWGRLCTPNPDDSNNRRWPDAPLWADLRVFAASHAAGVDWPMSRYGKEFHGMSEAYIKFLSGVISGGMARFNRESPSVYNMLDGLEKNGESLNRIQYKAEEKAKIISRL
ncbi:MAG: hypothetical protein HN392_00525 [Anaerolineae bacterium]|jgi:hypothetical protein|nr:hypothetical protein [Anaerolineae bacterium]MBT7073834.1 hypothetical protein [Anaerolineae bacterium]